jgi:hypothetical protein
LPRDAKPIGTADNDEVWTAVAQGIRAVVADAQQRGIGVAATNQANPMTPNVNELKKQLFELIAENELSQVFALLQTNKIIFKDYKTFEDEYTLDNPTGTKLKQFKDRLTTFINSKS